MRTIGKMSVGGSARVHVSGSVDTQCSYFFINKRYKNGLHLDLASGAT